MDPLISNTEADMLVLDFDELKEQEEAMTAGDTRKKTGKTLVAREQAETDLEQPYSGVGLS